MASTALADILKPQAISGYTMAQITTQMKLITSGAATFDLNALAGQGGDFITLRNFSEDTADDEVNDGVSASTPGNLAGYAEVAAVCHRKRVRGVDNVVKAAMGKGEAEAVNNEIARQNGIHWPRKLQVAMISVLKGLFDSSGGCLRTTHLNAIGAASGTEVKASFAALVDTCKKLGDGDDQLKLLIAHSYVIADLLKEASARIGAIPIDSRTGFPVYMGYLLAKDDGVPVSGSGQFAKYTTFIAAPGAMTFAIQREMQVLTELQALYPREIITSTLDFAAHVYGCKWNVTDTNPTNTNLLTANKWAKAATSDKLIRVVALQSNASQ